MEEREIVAVIKRRKETLEHSSMVSDDSEVLVKRGDMARMLIDEYGDILREIEAVKENGALTERRTVRRI